MFASSAGFHPSNLLFPTGVVAGALAAMSANVLLAVFNTYTVFAAATVPLLVSADSNVTAQYLSESGFPPSGFVGSFGPTMSFSKYAVKVDVVTGPVVGTVALFESCHFIKVFVSSLYVAVAGIFPVTDSSFHFTSFLTSNTSFAPCARLTIVPSFVGSKVIRVYPSGTVGNVPSFPGCGTITFGWLVNVIVPPSVIE